MQEYTNHSDTTFALRNISFRVPGRTLLHPLSLTFPAGKVTGLIGHNGSGKSTLLKMLGRHQPPSEGEILLDAQPLESWSSKAFARKVAYLPQQLPPAEGMTVRELVAIGRYPWHGALGRFGAADREKVEEAISLVGLKPLAHRLVDSLSGGERQRAWIAMLVAQDSRCLLLDEPTSALDISVQAQILNLLVTLQENHGLTYVLISHNVSVIRHMSDRVAVMYLGQIVELGDAQQVLTAPAHPYTRLLLDSLPAIDIPLEEGWALRKTDLPGNRTLPQGCFFRERCPLATHGCEVRQSLTIREDGREIRRWRSL